MPDPVAQVARLQGCDATHRADNSDTHLTHGCIAQFRHFLRVREECANIAAPTKHAIVPFFESAPRTLGEAAA